ncbi:MAG: lipoate--protein ligase family protein [Verrucomicrobia bacterium]|nr:lipoate--protein ligase family protein [Verrucomicrobiota bacterium]
MNWFLLQTGPGPAAFNMALDEALLEAASRLGAPVLRFYGWTEPAASFGYFQKFAEIERATRLRPLMRRPTGGGLVPHDADWTYSVVFPPTHAWHALTAVESYRKLHEWIRDSFRTLGVECDLADDCRSSAPGQCFAGWEKFDVLWHGRKIAGAAQRRNKFGLLIQGSIQPPPGAPAKVDWQKAFCDVAYRQFGANWEAFDLDTALRDRVEVLVAEKFSQPAYLTRR